MFTMLNAGILTPHLLQVAPVDLWASIAGLYLSILSSAHVTCVTHKTEYNTVNYDFITELVLVTQIGLQTLEIKEQFI
jgi:hypothetical protein